MYFLQLKKINYFLIVLIVLFCCINIFAKAEEDYLLPPEKTVDSVNEGNDYKSASSETFEEEQYVVSENPAPKKKYRKRSSLSIDDSAFTSENQLTFKDLFFKISFITFLLICFVLAIKIFLSRKRFGEPGSFLDNLASKLTGSFLPSGLKLLQTMILTPGQSLYVVEVEGKKLLIGGTHQGGVQFLFDLTEKKNNSIFEAKHLIDEQSSLSPFIPPNGNGPHIVEEKSNGSHKQAIKNRLSFKQSLLSKTSNNILDDLKEVKVK